MTETWAKRLRKSLIIVGTGMDPNKKFFSRPSFLIWSNLAMLATASLAPITMGYNNILLMLNQTVFALYNYGNRNDSAGYKPKDFLVGYAGTMTASLLMAFAFRALSLSIMPNISSKRIVMAHALLNYMMGALMAAINVLFMRFKEVTNGVKLQSKDGTIDNSNRRSRAAGRKGVF